MAGGLSEKDKKQMAQVEELLFSGPEKEGFAKELYFGRFRTDSLMPFPELPQPRLKVGDAEVQKVKKFCAEKIDADKIDRDGVIPDSVIKGLGKIGVLGFTVDKQFGGQGLSQYLSLIHI